jgi:hypothetical protein
VDVTFSEDSGFDGVEIFHMRIVVVEHALIVEMREEEFLLGVRHLLRVPFDLLQKCLLASRHNSYFYNGIKLI